jgi:hypothetical protein
MTFLPPCPALPACILPLCLLGLFGCRKWRKGWFKKRATQVIGVIFTLFVSALVFVLWTEYATIFAISPSNPDLIYIIGFGAYVVVLLLGTLGTFLFTRRFTIQQEREDRRKDIEEKMKTLEGLHPELALTLGVIRDMLTGELDLSSSRSFIGNLAQNAFFLCLGIVIPLVIARVFR